MSGSPPVFTLAKAGAGMTEKLQDGIKVYELYGLTDEEMRIVEDATGK